MTKFFWLTFVAWLVMWCQDETCCKHLSNVQHNLDNKFAKNTDKLKWVTFLTLKKRAKRQIWYYSNKS